MGQLQTHSAGCVSVSSWQAPPLNPAPNTSSSAHSREQRSIVRRPHTQASMMSSSTQIGDEVSTEQVLPGP